MRVACAVPTLPNVPRHPRGESKPPSVLMFAGGAFPGVSVVEPLATAANHGCCACTVVRNDCRLVPATGSNVHSTGPDTSGCASGSPGLTCTVSVPRHVPVRNDVGALGAVGFELLPPQAVRAI